MIQIIHIFPLVLLFFKVVGVMGMASIPTQPKLFLAHSQPKAARLIFSAYIIELAIYSSVVASPDTQVFSGNLKFCVLIFLSIMQTYNLNRNKNKLKDRYGQ